jgi:hypothetical protein
MNFNKPALVIASIAITSLPIGAIANPCTKEKSRSLQVTIGA